MTWFRVDDKLHDHRKARLAGKTAMGVWVLCGSWASDQLTDGFVPEVVLRRHGTAADAARLVKAGLWEPATQDGERGWRFHEWEQSNPSRATVLAERQAARERQAKARESRRDSPRDSQSESQRESHDPDPTRPLRPPNPPSVEGGHSGQHSNCRACGTSQRGPKPVLVPPSAVERCAVHVLDLPCRSCAADAKAAG